MKKIDNKKMRKGILVFAMAITLVLTARIFSVEAQASEKSFKEGVLYSDGDTINFGKEFVYFKVGELLYRVKGTLTVKQTGNKSEKAYSFELFLNDDTVLEHYHKTIRGDWKWTENEHEYQLPVILKGENYPKGFVFTGGKGTEEKPFILQASSVSVKPVEEDEKEPVMTKKMTAKQTTSKTTITWSKVKGAATYELYVAYEGNAYPEDSTVVVKKNKATIKKLNGKKISLKKNLKIKILAKDKKGNVIEEVEILLIGKKTKGYSAGSNIVVK